MSAMPEYPDLSKHNVVGFFLSLYLGLSPIYWCFNIPIDYIFYFKFFLLVLSALLILFLALRKSCFFFPSGVFGIPGLIILIFSMSPGLFQSGPAELVRRILDVLYGFIFLWSFYLYVRCRGDVYRVFFYASLIISFFSSIVVMSKFFPIINYGSPYLKGFYLSDTGFGGLRTGWSVGVSFFIPFCLMISFINGNKNSIKFLILMLLFFLPVFSSQVVVGGRSGIISSFIVIMIWFLKYKKYSIFWIILFLSLFLFFIDIEWMISHLRLDRLEHGEGFDALNNFSANRILVYYEAVKMILDRIFLGYGFGEINGVFLKHGDAVHNLWLRMLLQAGIVSFFVLVFIFGHYFFAGVKLYKKKLIDCPNYRFRYLAFAFFSSIFSGFVLSMFEPNVILGTFQISAAWWASVGAVKGLNDM